MTQATAEERLVVKTPEAAFLQVLEREFHFAPRLARDVLNAAQEGLGGVAAAIRPGQVRQVVASAKAPFGGSLAETAKVTVTLTVDAGIEDRAVKQREGSEGQRRGRILRLVEEALEQGGVLTQEDLARALGVTRRTIARDVRLLKEEGYLLHTRGQLKGVGRGQTHKVRIIELWLDREGYDKIARQLHHSPQAIKRYVNAFLRIVTLHEKGTPASEIAFLTQTTPRLVADYLALYQAAREIAHRQEKLAEELERVNPASQVGSGEKKGVMSQ
jgi:DNA-binding Lrp family transcriptional regulator